VRLQAPGVRSALGWHALSALVTASRTGVRPSRRLATAEFAHVPLRLGRVPVFVDRLVEGAHRIGVRVVLWTLDDPVDMRRALDAGVDGIITDRPDLLREVLIARGAWSPMQPAPQRTDPDTATRQ
jgi:glycerophosphoryl diester phosphodiesterase